MPEPTVVEYRLSPVALKDLDTIWGYTACTWSVSQAETYIAGSLLTWTCWSSIRGSRANAWKSARLCAFLAQDRI